jgi:hypothetical protein
MEIPTYIRVGGDVAVAIQPTSLDSPAIELTSDWAGSYHLHAMGHHFHDYVEHRFLPPLPPRPGFPASPQYTQLTQKLSAPSVSANIGEAIAAEWAVQTGIAVPQGVAHVSPHTSGRAKAPDYLIRFQDRLAALIPSELRQPLPTAFGRALADSPEWWPVESKARERDASYNTAYHEALIQLASYWWQLRNTPARAHAGYGVIVIFTTVATQAIYVSVLVPRQQTGLLNDLRSADQASKLVVGRRLRPGILDRLYGF